MYDRGPAVVLLSGGIDSATVLAIAQADGFEASTITFHYGQRHAYEITSARQIAKEMGVENHVIVEFDLRMFGSSALTSETALPLDRTRIEMGEGIPPTYVPARNTIFLSFALAWAETLGSGDIFLGVNALDYAGYPDCRQEYIDAYQRMANLATAAGVEGRTDVKLHAPLIQLSKAEIVREGLRLGVKYELTSSCYDPTPLGYACGRCDSCLLRLEAFAANNATDPIQYRARPT